MCASKVGSFGNLVTVAHLHVNAPQTLFGVIIANPYDALRLVIGKRRLINVFVAPNSPYVVKLLRYRPRDIKNPTPLIEKSSQFWKSSYLVRTRLHASMTSISAPTQTPIKVL